jgi:hypothetical protein
MKWDLEQAPKDKCSNPMKKHVVTPYFTSISSIDKVSTMGLQVMPLLEQSKWYHGSSMLGHQKCVPP